MRPYVRVLYFVFSLIILGSLISCQVGPTQLPIQPSETFTQSATGTSSPNPPTQIPIPTATSTEISTLISTPQGKDAREKIKYLMDTNGNCSFPCWWGIAPGKTTWDEANAYLSPFVDRIWSDGARAKIPTLEGYGAGYTDLSGVKRGATFDIDKSGTIKIVETNLDPVYLSSYIIKLGMPDEILINVETFPGGGPPPSATILLFYNSGAMIAYWINYKIDSNKFIAICPQDILPGIDVDFWDPSMKMTFRDIGGVSNTIPPLTPDDYFRPLGEVSDMKLQDFYGYYSKPSATHCIKTPASDWFHPDN
jgi:hypothetical protein